MDAAEAAEAAPAVEETAEDVAAAAAATIQDQLAALSEAQAKTVKPVDLIDPVNTELLGSPGDAPDVIVYSGQTDDYVRWQRDITNAISTAGLGWATEFFRGQLHLTLEPVVGVPVYIHEHCPVLTKQQGARLNSARAAKMARAREQVCGVVLASIAPSVAESITEGGAGVGRDPDKLVAAITVHARGTDARVTGADAVRQFYELQWRESPKTLVAQVDASFADMHRLQRVTLALGEDGYALSAQQLMVKAVSMMPSDLTPHVRTHQGCTTLQQLQNEMKKDAGRLDGSAAAGLTSFVTQTDRLQELEARIDLKIKELAGAGDSGRSRAGDSGRPRREHSRAVMTNPATPPDSSRRWQWCEHHGSWSATHKSSGCYVAHPELAPKRD